MARTGLVVAVLLVGCSCALDRERRLAATFEESKAAVRRGALSEALTLADRGLSQARADSTWAWTFRLHRGEILLLQHQPGEVAPLVKAALPDGAAFDEVRARQKFLEARLQLTENHLPEALVTLERAHHLAPEARDIQF